MNQISLYILSYWQNVQTNVQNVTNQHSNWASRSKYLSLVGNFHYDLQMRLSLTKDTDEMLLVSNKDLQNCLRILFRQMFDPMKHTCERVMQVHMGNRVYHATVVVPKI